MRFRIWHIFFVLLALGLVTGGIAYGQSPDPLRRGVTATAPTHQGGGEKFFKAGTTKYAAGYATDTVVGDRNNLDLGPQVSFNVPAGMKADIIATVSGEVTNPGATTGDFCIGVLTITNEPRLMNPAGGIIMFSQDVLSGGKPGGASIQQYLTNVPAGNHAVTFSMYAGFNPANDDQCQVGYRTITVIANIHP